MQVVDTRLWQWLLPGLALALFSTSAAAAPLSAPALHWVRGPGCERCVAPRSLAERVETLIGAPLVRAADAEHSIEGSIERSGRGFRATVRLTGRTGNVLGERSLAQPNGECARLTEPLAFVIAMMIDPEVVAHGLPPELLRLLGEEAPEQTLLAELEREPARPVTVTPVRKERNASGAAAAPITSAPATAPRFQVAVALGSALWAGPRPALTGQLLVMAALGEWFGLGASVWGGSQLRRESDAARRSFRVAMAGLEALLCAASPSSGRWRVSGCVGPGLWLRSARGEGIGRDKRATLVSGSAAAFLTVRVRLRAGWGLSTLLGSELSFARSELVYVSADGERHRVYRFLPASLILGVGPSFEF